MLGEHRAKSLTESRVHTPARDQFAQFDLLGESKHLRCHRTDPVHGPISAADRFEIERVHRRRPV